MSQDTIRLVVINENTLGYSIGNGYYGILRASVLKGSVMNEWNNHKVDDKNVRLATEKDFEDYRVVFDGYKNDPSYTYQK